MEPEQQNSPTASSEAEAARSRFLDSMGLGEAALRDMAPAQSGERSDGMVLSSQSDELQVPAVAPVSPAARVVGVQIGPPPSDSLAAPEETAPISKGFENEPEIPSVASLEDDPVADIEELEAKASIETPAKDAPEEIVEEELETLQLCCPKCSGELVIRREHVGIEGACVWCDTKIVAAASGTDGQVRAFAVFQPDPVADAGSKVVEVSEESPEDTPEDSPEDELPAEDQSKANDAPAEEQDSSELPPEVSAWSGKPIETSEAESATVEEMKPDLDGVFPEVASQIGEADGKVDQSEPSDGFSSLGFAPPEDTSTEAFPPDTEQFGIPSGFSTEQGSNIEERISSPEPDDTSQPFENALQPLPSGFSNEQAPAIQDGFGEFLQSKEKTAAADAFGDFMLEAGSDPSAGFEDETAQAAFGSPALPPSVDAKIDAPFEGEVPSLIPATESSVDLSGFEGDSEPQPPDSEKDPFGASAIFGGPTPPPLNEIPEGFASTGAEELEFSGDLPEPAPADSVEDSGFASGFAIPATSDQDSFSIDDPFTAEFASVPASEKEASSNPPPLASGWGESPPIGVSELPVPETATEEANEIPLADGGDATDLNGLFAPSEESEESRRSAFEEPDPVPEVGESGAQESESSDLEETMVQAIALPADGATPTVTSQSLGSAARKRPRKGLVVFLVVLIGFTCGAALASFMLPVDEYVLKARAFMEEKFDPAAVQQSLVPADVLTPAPEANAPES